MFNNMVILVYNILGWIANRIISEIIWQTKWHFEFLICVSIMPFQPVFMFQINEIEASPTLPHLSDKND